MNKFSLLFLIVLYSCSESKKEPDFDVEIERLTAEIEMMVAPKSCATNEDDCRLKVLKSPDNCGPAFVYNVKDVDSQKLEHKFSELEKLKMDQWNTVTEKSTCYWVAPNATAIVDCNCTVDYNY